MRPFDEVVAEQGTVVLRVCRALVGPVDADDAWSETFIAALGAYPELPSGSNVQAWLVTIAKRKSIDLLRARGRRPVPLGELPERTVDASRSAADVVEQREVWTLVAALTDRQRDALVYHHVAGMSFVEVAALIGGSEAAVRRAAADARARLRQWMAEDGSATKTKESAS